MSPKPGKRAGARKTVARPLDKLAPGAFATLSGGDLTDMVVAGATWIEGAASEINALNVFPVPDGDTGTNMLLTLRATIEEARACPAPANVGAVAQAMAHGALMGGRGNSGVILSQLFQGIAQAFRGKDTAAACDVADALAAGTDLAYKAVSSPVEGTMLTVLKDAAAAARGAASRGAGALDVLDAAVRAAWESVARTPDLLPVLREAGVVDAGGKGLAVLLDGAVRFLRGEGPPPLPRGEAAAVVAPPTPPAVPAGAAARRSGGARRAHGASRSLGYCVEFIIQGRGLDMEAIRRNVGTMGESVIVAGDEAAVKVHLHTRDPETPLGYARRLGAVVQAKAQDIDEQHREFAQRPDRIARLPVAQVGIVAVTPGEGIAEVVRSLGAVAVLPAGASGKPSVQDLLRAIGDCPARSVLLLPNSGDVLPAAEQAARLASKRVLVVPTRTAPQGMAALVAFRAEAGLEANAAAMAQTAAQVRSAEVTTAARPARINGRRIAAGQVIGLLEGELVAVDASREAVVRQVLDRMAVEAGRLVTLYYGGEASREEAETLARWARERFPGCEVEVVAGLQRHYHYYIAVE